MAAALGTIILGSLLAGETAYGIAGDIKAGKAAKKTADFEAGILEEQADDAILIGQEAVGRSRSASRQLAGAQRASQAAEGLDTSSGSPAQVISNDQALGEQEVMEIENNVAREALGLRKQAQLVRMGGKASADSYRNRAYGTLLSGATSLYGLYDANRSTKRYKPGPVGRGTVDNSGGYGQR